MVAFRHGKTKTKTYWIWKAMRQRCYNPKHKGFKNYGARGIGAEKRWEIYLNFLVDMGECPDGYTLERKDNNKGYSKDNCYWSDRIAQANNRRSNAVVYLWGSRYSLRQACIILNISERTVRYRKYYHKERTEEALYNVLTSLHIGDSHASA